MVNRRVFLGWSSFLGLGVLAHHRPGHRGGPPTTTTTIPAEAPGGGVYSDLYADLY